MLVVWDEDALSDLETIGAFIAQDSPSAARRVARLLETSPHLGRPAMGREGVRELTISRYPYVLVYEIANEELRILAVVHQAQNRP